MANRVSKRLARLDKHKSATRRFPPPWTVEQIPGGYKVKDANGQSLAYVYGRETKLTPTSPTSSPWTRLDGSRATSLSCRTTLRLVLKCTTEHARNE
jgi:hypothetical protein